MTFSNTITKITKGKPYCYVCMPFHEKFIKVYSLIKKTVGEFSGLQCFRHDDLTYGNKGSDSLLQEIHAAIDLSDLVIIDLSETNPNVLYEIGYTFGQNKNRFIIAPEDENIPTDLKSLRILKYQPDSQMRDLKRELIKFLTTNFSNLQYLRSMLIPTDLDPTFILANPKPPPDRVRKSWKSTARKTYGDHIGVVGILLAFGQIRSNVIPQLDSGSWSSESILDWDCNMYLIGSPKVNDAVEIMLNEMQKESSINWDFFDDVALDPK